MAKREISIPLLVLCDNLRVRNPARLLIHIPVPWVFVLSYLIGAGIEHFVPTGAKTLHGLNAAGGVLFLFGAVIAGWGLLIFHKQRTTTTPGMRSSKLVTWGPYRFTRNPMYVGLVLAYLGEAGLLKQAWPVVLLPLTVAYVNYVVIPLEEARLHEVFPGEYEQYRSKVRRWI